MNEMRVIDSEMSMRSNNEAWSIPEISVVIYIDAHQSLLVHGLLTELKDINGLYGSRVHFRARIVLF